MLRSRCGVIGLVLVGTLLVFLVLPSGAFAVIASPDEFTLEQPDGTTFKAHKWGDERQSGWETPDGYTIVFDEKLNRWTYAVLDPSGKLVGSSYVAGKDVPPPGLKAGLRPKAAKGLSLKTTKEKNFKPSAPAKPLSVPSLSLVVPSNVEANVPVILINFQGSTTTFTPAQFNDLLFSSDPTKFSMKDYYEEVSYGAFSVSGGAPGVMGWYMASHDHNWYGDYYNPIGVNVPDLVWDAVAAADAAGVDFAQYDSDGDCYVDVVAIIHQGTGKEASTNRYDIWSHSANLYDWQQYGYGKGIYSTMTTCPTDTAQKIKVNDYIMMPEKQGTAISTMGVFAHEYGHALGLPDLYDTDDYYSTAGIGRWSLMAAGNWNKVSKSGDRPAHMDAWCKYALGWVTPTLVTSPVTNAPIATAATSASVYQLLSGSPNVSGEYFLVENRQKVGFDAGLPGAGLLIWHIDESQTSNDCAIFPFVWQGSVTWINEYDYFGNPACPSTKHYHVALVQADNKYQLEGGSCRVAYPYVICTGNYGDTGDPFPGTTKNYWFYGTSTPFNNSNLYNGSSNGNTTPSNVIVGDISNSGPVMTASMAAEPLAHIPLETALDDPALGTSLSFSSADWYGQALVSKYGGSAAKSGDIMDGQSSAMTTSVTGPATLAFLWKVSSQPSSDYVSFAINGVVKAKISGSVAWQLKGFVLPAGSNTLTWTYVKNSTISLGMDAAWVDRVVVSPYTKVAVVTPNGGEVVPAGTDLNISWAAPAAAEKFNLWYTPNGSSWISIASGVTGTSYLWKNVPGPNGNKATCKVKVTAYNGLNAVVGTDISDKPFTIEVLKVNSPNGGEPGITGNTPTDITYTINPTISPVTSVQIAYTINGTSWNPAVTGPVTMDLGPNTVSWTTPAVTSPMPKCKVKVTSYNGTKVIATDMSDNFFTINPSP